MTFKDFVEIYMQDMKPRLKPSTILNKRWMIDLKITPYFDKIPLNEIKPTDIRSWQNTLTGIREGELLALTPSDIDLDKKTLTVNKSYQRLNGEDVITSPKTPKSNRTIPIPEGLCDCLREYMERCFELQPSDRLFLYTKSFLYHEMENGCKKAGVKRIRVHDLRHSHASLLVEMGFSPLLIAERLGHEKVQTTMETYSHLYPNKQVEAARQLDSIMQHPAT